MSELNKNFYDVSMSDLYSYGATFSTVFNTQIINTQSGYEYRIARWESPLIEIAINYSTTNQDKNNKFNIDFIRNFYNICQGPTFGFLFNNKTDNTIDISESLLNKDNILKGFPRVKLYKKYGLAGITNYATRRIYKPKPGTFKLYRNNILVDELSYNVDYKTGILTLPLLSNPEITSIEKGSATRVFCTNTFQVNDIVYFRDILGMTELNNQTFIISSATADSFVIDVNSTNFNDFIYEEDRSFVEHYVRATDVLTYECEFYTPVRFKDNNSLPIIYETFNKLTVTTQLTEIRLDDVEDLDIDY